MNKIITNIILAINFFVILLMVIADKIWKKLGLTEADNIYYSFVGIIIFGVSIGGLLIGIYEYKIKGKKTLIGIIGNSILTLFFIVILLYVAWTIKKK